MTFAELKARVQARLKLSSAESDVRIGQYLNERYRAVATSCGLLSVRFGTVSQATSNGVASYSPATLIQPMTVVCPQLNRVLPQTTKDFIRNMDPDATMSGAPQYWALTNHGASSVTILLWPTPDTTIYTLSIDGILQGTDLAGSNIPVLPEDFHDVLVFGAVADELIKLEKPDLSDKMEARYRTRLAELRYFVAKTAYLDMRAGQGDTWWWGFWWGTYGG